MTGVLTSITVGKSPQRIQTWLAQNDSFLLVNTDIANAIYIGNDPGSQLVQIPPLGSVTLEASTHDTWVSTGGNNYTVIAYLLPAGTNWTPSPAQVAASISALGLATATNQATQITNENTTATNTGTTATNTATTATNVASVNTSVGNVNTSVGNVNTSVGNVNTSVQATPNATAAYIATGSSSGAPGGAPLLRNTKNLGTASNATTAAATTTVLVSTTTINQPGYEGVFQISMPAGTGTIPFVKVLVIWTDSASGLTVGQRTFFMTCGNGPSNALPFYINGPARGNQVSVSITNLDASATATYTWAFNMTSHIYEADKIVQSQFSTTAPNGYSWPAGFPNAGVICNSNPSLPASSAASRLLPAFSGRATFMLNNSGTTSIHAYLTDPVASSPGLYGNAQSRYEGFSVLANGITDMAEVNLPYGPLLLTVTNESTTTAGACNVGIIGSDY